MATFTKTRDHISPDLRARSLRDAGTRREIFAGIGTVFTSLAQRAISEPHLRPAPWPALKSGAPATLRDTGALLQSIRVIDSNSESVTSGSDRPYAAIHQFGGTIHFKPRSSQKSKSKSRRKAKGKSRRRSAAGYQVVIPARPYFPVQDGKLTDPAKRRIADIIKHTLGA